MAELVDVKVKLTKRQIKRLTKGLSVRLKADALTGDSHILLSKVRANRLLKRRLQGKGMEIKLCQRGIEGSGFGKDVKKALGKAGKFVWDNRKDIAKGAKTALEIAMVLKQLKGGDVDEAKQLKEGLDELRGGCVGCDDCDCQVGSDAHTCSECGGSGKFKETLKKVGKNIAKGLKKAGTAVYKHRGEILEGVKTGVEVVQELAKLKAELKDLQGGGVGIRKTKSARDRRREAQLANQMLLASARGHGSSGASGGSFKAAGGSFTTGLGASGGSFKAAGDGGGLFPPGY